MDLIEQSDLITTTGGITFDALAEDKYEKKNVLMRDLRLDVDEK